MSLEYYLLYIAIAALTIASPGPGILLTVRNTLHSGFSYALPGIAGIAAGMCMIAVISATALGVLLAQSALAFSLLKYLGAAYLLYLGLKMLRNQQSAQVLPASKEQTPTARFLESFTICVLNPKPIFFFLSLFPQFIAADSPYLMQFALLTTTFCVLVFAIHGSYALLVKRSKQLMNSNKGRKLIDRLAGITFISFGLGLANSSQR